MYEIGATHEDVAYALDRSNSTIRRWHVESPEFSATQKGRELADAEIVRSLFLRAKGYMSSDGTHVPAHPTAIIYWLKNRQPGKWRDKREVEHAATPAATDMEGVAEQLLSQVNAHPTLAPVLRQWAERLVARLPKVGT